MRILHVISGLGIGGAETMLLRLVTHPLFRPHPTLVVALAAGGSLRDKYRDAGIDTIEIGLRSPLQAPAKLIGSVPGTAFRRARCSIGLECQAKHRAASARETGYPIGDPPPDSPLGKT
jgi:hypothetical protein